MAFVLTGPHYSREHKHKISNSFVLFTLLLVRASLARRMCVSLVRCLCLCLCSFSYSDHRVTSLLLGMHSELFHHTKGKQQWSMVCQLSAWSSLTAVSKMHSFWILALSCCLRPLNQSNSALGKFPVSIQWWKLITSQSYELDRFRSEADCRRVGRYYMAGADAGFFLGSFHPAPKEQKSTGVRGHVPPEKFEIWKAWDTISCNFLCILKEIEAKIFLLLYAKIAHSWWGIW